MTESLNSAAMCQPPGLEEKQQKSVDSRNWKSFMDEMGLNWAMQR